MKQESKLNPQQGQEQAAQAQNQAAGQAKEFATPEEMLRQDAAQTPVPPGVEQRLQQSISELPKPPRSWWRRLLGS